MDGVGNGVGNGFPDCVAYRVRNLVNSFCNSLWDCIRDGNSHSDGHSNSEGHSNSNGSPHRLQCRQVGRDRLNHFDRHLCRCGRHLVVQVASSCPSV